MFLIMFVNCTVLSTFRCINMDCIGEWYVIFNLGLFMRTVREFASYLNSGTDVTLRVRRPKRNPPLALATSFFSRNGFDDSVSRD